MDYKLGQRYKNAILELDFRETKDVLGWYFDKTVYKISIMKHGPHYICYYNIYKNNQWNLIKRSNIFHDFVQALQWSYECARQSI